MQPAATAGLRRARVPQTLTPARLGGLSALEQLDVIPSTENAYFQSLLRLAQWLALGSSLAAAWALLCSLADLLLDGVLCDYLDVLFFQGKAVSESTMLLAAPRRYRV